MERLRNLLQAGRAGNAVLFCGSGLTADCLNFQDELSLGVSSNLLSILNNELKNHGKESGFKNIKNAAKSYKSIFGSHALMQLLKNRFHVSKVSSSIEDILKYPWEAIYTTNYDNGIEIALQGIGKKFAARNNCDDPIQSSSSIEVIHLHGYAQSWDISNFDNSCILDSDSYRQLDSAQKWFGRLRSEIERASVVIFVGFSVNDMHLDQVFFNSSGISGKSFFINKQTASPDADERAVQQDFGTPLYIGREQLAEEISEVSRRAPPYRTSPCIIHALPPADAKRLGPSGH